MRKLRPSSLFSLASAREGAMTVVFAIALPVLVVLGCGAVDLANLYGDRERMQDVADSTALMAGKQLGTATVVGISSRAQQYALAQLSDISAQVSLNVSTTVGGTNNSQVTVAISGHRDSFFANLLPPGGWNISVQSTASTMGETPLCVLATATQTTQGVELNNTSQVEANRCLAQSNASIEVAGGAQMTAGVAQAVGTATGSITPSPQTGAPSIPDPFASLPIDVPAPTCAPGTTTSYVLGVNILQPGVHCGNFVVGSTAVLLLEPGEHYFVGGNLTMNDASVLTGIDTVLIFGSGTNFNFNSLSLIDLVGRKTGPYAGFVIVTTRDNTNDFMVTSSNAEELLGTVYIPSARLHLNGSGIQVALLSAWTVVVANAVETDGSAQLIINSDYGASDVPVPGGVGPNVQGQVVLAR
jgi:Flp pilus assembly protein TadG